MQVFILFFVRYNCVNLFTKSAPGPREYEHMFDEEGEKNKPFGLFDVVVIDDYRHIRTSVRTEVEDEPRIVELLTEFVESIERANLSNFFIGVVACHCDVCFHCYLLSITSV